MKKLLSATAALAFVALTAPANAADLPVKAPPIAMPVLYNWSGIYIGVEGGAVMGQTTHWTEIDPLAEGHTDESVDIGHPLHGGFVGGEAGFNWQSGRWVFGIEGDGNWAELEEALTCENDAATSPQVDIKENCGSRISSFYTARARIGYALGPTGSFLVYVTGGGAWASQSARIGTLTVGGTTPVFPSTIVTFEQWKNTAGWTAGMGAEYGITPWLSVKGEVLYVDLAGKDYDLTGCISVIPDCEHAHIQHNFIMARMGLNWRFNWGKGKGPGPVVARY